MNVLLIAALGILVVLASILWLRLHPLLGLLIGSLFLLAATPSPVFVENQIKEKLVTIEVTAENEIESTRNLAAGDYCIVPAGGLLADAPQVVTLQRKPVDQGAINNSGVSPVRYRVSGDVDGLQAGDALVATADYDQAKKSQWSSLGGRLADGFTKTFRKLGIPVTMAAIVGICLLQSGAAAKLVASIMRLFGPRGTAPALTVSGFVLGIPVFFDNVFYLLLPLAKAVGRTDPKNFLTAVMAIIVGATMAHSLVPPTPGPLFVAEQIGVSVGMMMVAGFIVGGCAASVGFAYGKLCSRWIQISPDRVADGEKQTHADGSSIPLWLAALPIALPVVLLGGSEVVEYFAKTYPQSIFTSLHEWTAIVNEPSLVFVAAAVVAIALLRRFADREHVASSVARGISDAGTIVLLTSAGGAFGASLQQLQIAGAIAEQFSGLTTPWGLLCTAFFLTTIIRAAQGSATVAMLTSSAIVAPVLETTQLPFHPIYIALAIGCGSKPLPWMNDSGFWQVATMSGMTTSQTLRTFSVALTIMGCVGFLVTCLGAWLVPLT